MNSKGSTPYYNRFKGLNWFNRISNSQIIIFGQGGIGSHLSFFLSRAGANLIVVDFDKVEEHNLAGQLYGKDDVGKSKTSAIADVLTRLCGNVNLIALDEQVKSKGGDWRSLIADQDVVCVSFDNIAARKLVYEEWKKTGKGGSLFVDGRIS